jgi:hypothetical protein
LPLESPVHDDRDAVDLLIEQGNEPTPEEIAESSLICQSIYIVAVFFRMVAAAIIMKIFAAFIASKHAPDANTAPAIDTFMLGCGTAFIQPIIEGGAAKCLLLNFERKTRTVHSVFSFFKSSGGRSGGHPPLTFLRPWE